MTSGTATNSVPAFQSVEQAATAWVEAQDEYTRLGKLYRAAEARRKAAGEYLDAELVEGNLIEVGGRRYRFLHKVRTVPQWKPAFMAVRSIVDATMQAMMDRAVETNTNTSEQPLLEEVPVN